MSRLDDASLQDRLHQANRDSLVHWLEFKNDDEFPTSRLGSVAGGNALKFTIFYRRETGSWMGRNPNNNTPVEITPEEALKWARKHRDRLLAGVELLRKLPTPASDADYEQLQKDMDSIAPDVSNLAWGHAAPRLRRRYRARVRNSLAHFAQEGLAVRAEELSRPEILDGRGVLKCFQSQTAVRTRVRSAPGHQS